MVRFGHVPKIGYASVGTVGQTTSVGSKLAPQNEIYLLKIRGCALKTYQDVFWYHTQGQEEIELCFVQFGLASKIFTWANAIGSPENQADVYPTADCNRCSWGEQCTRKPFCNPWYPEREMLLQPQSCTHQLLPVNEPTLPVHHCARCRLIHFRKQSLLHLQWMGWIQHPQADIETEVNQQLESCWDLHRESGNRNGTWFLWQSVASCVIENPKKNKPDDEETD